MKTQAVTAISTGFCRKPEILATCSIGSTTLWRMVKENRFPQPVRPSPFGEHVTVWRREDITAFIRGEWQPAPANDAKGG